jgi:hypothetical protein
VPRAGVMLHTEDDWYARLVPDRPLDLIGAAAELENERRRRS